MSLVGAFLEGAQRVTVEIYYYKPRAEGAPPLVVQSLLLGVAPREVPHSGILTPFIHQFDDAADLEPPLKRAAEEILKASSGIVRFVDANSRLETLFEEAAYFNAGNRDTHYPRLETAPKIRIPKPEESHQAAMREERDVFKTVVPFPRVRKFLQFWQGEIDGPLHHLRFSGIPLANVRPVQQQLAAIEIN